VLFEKSDYVPKDDEEANLGAKKEDKKGKDKKAEQQVVLN